jgi:SAM-dependent methyltransferase
MDLVDAERDKYRRMWARPEYRQHSPGLRMLSKFLDVCDPMPGDSILDAGCGTGRAGLDLSLFYRVTQLDICDTARDADTQAIPFIHKPIHELHDPYFQYFGWIYCVDVLEHIPPELLDRTLAALARATVNGAFLQIACFEDGCGALIGERLHMIVRPPHWWKDQIGRHWTIRRDLSDEPQYAIFVCGR